MSDSNRLETYHTLFSLVVEDPRITPKKIAKRLNYSGQGKAPSTLLYHLQNMYEQKISFPPKLKLKPYEDWIPMAYICRKKDMKNTYSAFQYLKRDDDILYVMMLSGADFFIVSSNPNLNIKQYGLQIEKKSIFYHSIYTIPKGWKDTPDDVFHHVLNSNFEKGKIMRKLHGVLDWTKLEWKIFFSMYENVRKKISVVTRQTDVTYKTVKRHFEDFVLPKCSIAHYFFPEGYDNYKYMYLRMKSDFEKSLIASFKYWPCTTYFYPLEDELDAVLFFESHEKILELLEKLKEIDVISDYLLYIPIVHGND